MMQHCWKSDSRERPSFEDLSAYLSVLTNINMEDEDEEYDNVEDDYSEIVKVDDQNSTMNTQPEISPPELPPRQKSSTPTDPPYVPPRLTHLSSKKERYSRLSNLYHDPRVSVQQPSHPLLAEFRQSQITNQVRTSQT